MSVDIGMFAIIAVLSIAVVLTLLGLMIGRKPVVTEFEARRRRLRMPERSVDERTSDRDRSEGTMKTAMQLLLVFLAGLAIFSAVTYIMWREYLVYLTPVYAGALVLLFFFLVWLDEERMKARYAEVKIRR